jgi:hypothetical protein
LTSALEGGEWSASRTGRTLSPRKGPLQGTKSNSLLSPTLHYGYSTDHLPSSFDSNTRSRLCSTGVLGSPLSGSAATYGTAVQLTRVAKEIMLIYMAAISSEVGLRYVFVSVLVQFCKPWLLIVCIRAFNSDGLKGTCVLHLFRIVRL